MKNIQIKSVGSESADLIIDIHFDSVHKGNASLFYSKEILNEWSPSVSEQRVNEFRNRISKTQPMAAIAFDDELPVGFGIFDLKWQRIGAIYVKAAYNNCHVGVSLLNNFEKMAIQNGCEKLHLDSSLNARGFYEKQGYVRISESLFTLPSGIQMKSVSMSKMLTKG